jgi:hypothetical protein
VGWGQREGGRGGEETKSWLFWIGWSGNTGVAANQTDGWVEWVGDDEQVRRPLVSTSRPTVQCQYVNVSATAHVGVGGCELVGPWHSLVLVCFRRLILQP